MTIRFALLVPVRPGNAELPAVHQPGIHLMKLQSGRKDVEKCQTETKWAYFLDLVALKSK
jgi:hypothetical protein